MTTKGPGSEVDPVFVVTKHTGEPTMTNNEAVYPEERFDDEERSEFFDTTWKANIKEGFDVFRGDDRTLHRTMLNEYTRAVRRAEAREDDLRAMFLAQLSNQQQVTNRDQLQSTAHRDLAIAQQWRDQARDSGESVFKPDQSS